MDVSNVCYRAAFTAGLAHYTQSYGSNPYFFHLSMVVAVLQEFGVTDEEVLAAGWLHDVVEDTDYTHELVTALFGKRISAMVWACTGDGGSRKERNASIEAKLCNAESEDAVLVKAADRIANVRSSIWTNPGLKEMYAREMVAFTLMLMRAGNNIESGPGAILGRMVAELKRLA